MILAKRIRNYIVTVEKAAKHCAIRLVKYKGKLQVHSYMNVYISPVNTILVYINIYKQTESHVCFTQIHLLLRDI